MIIIVLTKLLTGSPVVLGRTGMVIGHCQLACSSCDRRRTWEGRGISVSVGDPEDRFLLFFFV